MRSIIAIAGLGVMAAFGLTAGEGPRIRIGGVGVTAGYGYANGPGYWGPGYWGPGLWRSYSYGGLWDPWYYSGWAHPGLRSGFGQGPGMGQVKLASAPKEAMVYLDGAFAGPAAKLKSMWLEPGVYNVEVREGNSRFEKRIYVLSGKTLQLRAELR